jgi:hypothetical protein
LSFELFDRCAVRRVDNVRVDVERRLDARVPELLLRDLHRHTEIVEQRRVNVAELMPRHASESRAFRRPSEHALQQLRFAERFAPLVREDEIVVSLARRSIAMSQTGALGREAVSMVLR